MRYNPEKHKRRSIRLRGYDYTTPNTYFVTICAYDRAYLFGDIRDGAMSLNVLGSIVEQQWHHSATVRQQIRLDAFVIMPNHIHGIVSIVAAVRRDGDPSDIAVGAHCNDQNPSDAFVGAHCNAPLRNNGPKRPPASLGSFVAAFKAAVTRRAAIECPAVKQVWQRNYYESIIRDQGALETIRHYIRTNPENWATDTEFRVGK